jgi:hypothetical protein
MTRSLVAFVVLILTGLASAQSGKLIKIHEGAHWTWYAPADQWSAHKADIQAQFGYADKAFEAIVQAWGFKPVEARYSVVVWSKAGGGFAKADIEEVKSITGKTSPGIGCSYDAFPGIAHGIKGYWATVVLTQEMADLFNRDLMGGGWPFDWWPNEHSAFATMTATEVEYRLAPPIAGYQVATITDPLFFMFLNLKDEYGWDMFRQAFKIAQDDGIEWDKVDINPSPLLTNYVAAYLEIGAKGDLSPVLAGVVPRYNHKAVEDIINARSLWLIHSKDSADYKTDQDAFLSGKFADVK